MERVLLVCRTAAKIDHAVHVKLQLMGLLVHMKASLLKLGVTLDAMVKMTHWFVFDRIAIVLKVTQGRQRRQLR